MNWLKTYVTRNNILRVIAGVVAVAGIPVALAGAGVAVPAVILGVATKVAIFGTTAGVAAAKILPGHGDNAPEKPLEMPKT